MTDRRRRLFPRYAAALMGLTAVVVMAISTIYLVVLYREVRDAASSVQRSEVRVAAVRIEQFLTGIRDSLSEVASLPWNSEVLSRSNRREEYHRLMKIQPALSEIRWIDNDGLERLHISRFEMDTQESRQPIMGRDAVGSARKQGFVYGRPYFKDGSEPYLSLAISSRNDSNGIVVAEIDLKFVTDVVQRIQLAGGGAVYVAGSDDRLIAHPNIDLVLRQTDLAKYAPLSEVHKALASSQGEPVGMFEGPGLQSTDVLLSGGVIPSAGWVVVAEQPKNVVLAPVYQALIHTGYLVLASLGAALLVSYWLARRLARPILQLRQGAERIARGDLSARIRVKSDDEVEALADEFNRMAAQLQEYTTGLERKVQVKTADLQAALGVAQEAVRARSIFLAAASHDLRQPLYAISILADTLALESMPPGAANILEKQRHAIAVLRSLFDNLLDLSRFDAGEIRPVLRVASLSETLAPLVLDHEVVCHSKQLTFECDIGDAWVRTDPELIRRVVGNLLSNAVRYTPTGTVSLRAEQDGDRVCVSVMDTGIGIDAKDQQRVFEEFVQISNPSRDRDKGVGLGLSIVKRISDLLDLGLVLESRAGKGTAVTFRVPIAAGVGGRAAQVDLAYAAAGAFKGARIWIVEDDPLVRDALALQFNSWEALPAFANSTAEVLSLREADGRWPDAVILDDMLGDDERGLEISSLLREFMEAHRIVMVTGNVDPERVALLETSGLAVLRKPLSSTDLAQWLRHALGAAPRASPVPAHAG